MESSKMKNMVVLKNIPSNIIDEAIIILKNGKRIRKMQKVENEINNKKQIYEEKDNDNKYIIKEAEMIINNYIEKSERNKKKTYFNSKNTIDIKKYKKVKKYSTIITGICILESILLIF